MKRYDTNEFTGLHLKDLGDGRVSGRLFAKVTPVDEGVNEFGGIGVIEVWASTEDVDRHHEIVRASAFTKSVEAMRVSRKFPPFLSAHQHVLSDGSVPVLGRVIPGSVEIIAGKGVKCRVGFVSAKVNKNAPAWFEGYRVKALTDVSVGFIGKRVERPETHTGNLAVVELDWLELSGAAVASNRATDAISVSTKAVDDLIANAADDYSPALKALLTELRNLGELQETRTVVPAKRFPLADVEKAWSWTTPTQDAVLATNKWDRYASAHTWFDSAADPNSPPQVKSAYKLPHHEMGDSGLTTVFRGVVAAMGAVLGARGGVDIPQSDRKRVYDHLASHYREFDKEAPEFRELSAAKFMEITKAAGIDYTAKELGLDGDTGRQSVAYKRDGNVVTIDLAAAKAAGYDAAAIAAWIKSEKAPNVHGDDDRGHGEERQAEMTEDEENIFAQIAPSDAEYAEGTVREIDLVTGEMPVKATIGVPISADEGAAEAITFLRFPKADGWTMENAAQWLMEANLDSLLTEALAGDQDNDEGQTGHREEDKDNKAGHQGPPEGGCPPGTEWCQGVGECVPITKHQAAHELAKLLPEAVQPMLARLERATANAEAMQTAMTTIVARSATILDNVNKVVGRLPTTSQSVKSVAPGHDAGTRLTADDQAVLDRMEQQLAGTLETTRSAGDSNGRT